MALKDSANFADIRDSINDAKTNKLQLSNVCTHAILYDNIKITDTMLFQDYWFLIEPKLVKYVLQDEHQFRPETFAKQVYGTSDLWYLVLWTNKMTSPIQFTGKTVLVFPPEELPLISRLLENNKKKLALDQVSPTVLPDLTIKKII